MKQAVFFDKSESCPKKLGEFQKSLGVFWKNLGELLEKVGDFMRTLGDFDRYPRKRKGFSLKGQRKTAHYGHVKPWCAVFYRREISPEGLEHEDAFSR